MTSAMVLVHKVQLVQEVHWVVHPTHVEQKPQYVGLVLPPALISCISLFESNSLASKE